MKNKPSVRGPWPRPIVTVALSAALAACGGGGGGGSSTPPPPQATIDITALNRDSVGHASAVGILALGPVGAVPLAAIAAAGPARSPAAAPTRGWLSRLLPVLLQPPIGTPARASGATAQPSAVFVSGPTACTVSGTVKVTADDRDGNGGPSAGDVLTIEFAACVDTADETLDGSATITYTQISQAPTPAVVARMAMTRFSDAAPNHAITLDGVLLLDYSRPSASITSVRLTAEGDITNHVTTHVFTDTVKLHDRFVEQLTFDSSVAAPTGGTQPGLLTVSVTGSLDSTAAGGIVEVSTPSASLLNQYADDPYPRSGTVHVMGKGNKSTLGITALRVGTVPSVQLSLDADGNGISESTEAVTWDWLL